MTDFNPGDNEVPLGEIDWRARYEQLSNERNWDEETQFVGMKRLGKTYSMLEPYFKFDGVPEHQRGYDRGYYPVLGAGICFFISIYVNKTFYKHYFGNILGHVGWIITGGLIGNSWYYWNNKRHKDREAVLRHYMILHEHELPIIERKKFGELMRPWVAFRPMDSKSLGKKFPFTNPKNEII